MFGSKCCKKSVNVESANEYGAYYVCDGCFGECDIIVIDYQDHKELDNAEVQSGIVFEALNM